MNIVFWSPVAGRCNVSSSMTAFATYVAMTTEHKCCILPLNVENRGAQIAFVSIDSESSIKKVLGGFGIDAVLMSSLSKGPSEAGIEDCALRIRNNLDFFANSTDPRVETVKASIVQNYSSILTKLENSYDLSFIDGGSGYSEVTETILSHADVIIACLSQSCDVAESLFEMIDLSSSKCMFLITNYDNKIKYGSSKIKSSYKGAKNGVFVAIPHNPSFANSINKSSLLKWMITSHDKYEKNKPKLKDALGLVPNDSDDKFFLSMEAFADKFFKLIGGKN